MIKNQKGIISQAIVVLVLLLGVGIAVYLSLNPQILRPRASSDPQTKQIKVLVLKYLPLDSTGTKLNINETDTDEGMSSMRQKLNSFTQDLTVSLNNGSRYKGYSQSSPQAFNINIFADKEYLEALPPGLVLDDSGAKRPDYKAILNRENICDLVDNKGLNQVWLYGYHTKNIVPVESNMSMGNSSRSSWNHETYGDVSNSEQSDDLPVCNKTYVLYNYNFTRGVGEMVHNHGHHLEQLFTWVEGVYLLPASAVPNSLFWGKLVGSDTPFLRTARVLRPGCGWAHYPPNANNEYEYDNSTKRESDCEDWKPDGTGAKKPVSCANWGCSGDTQKQFIVWWMQNLPGLNTNLRYQDKQLRNFWEFYIDFDEAVKKGRTLLEDIPASSAPTSTPTPTPTPTVNPSSSIQLNSNLPSKPSVQIKCPVQLSTVSWSGGSGGQYILEISEDSRFSSEGTENSRIGYKNTGSTQNSYLTNLYIGSVPFNIVANKKYYIRVYDGLHGEIAEITLPNCTN